MYIHEVVLDDKTLMTLVEMSERWASEDSCYGYRPNERADLEGNRIFYSGEGQESHRMLVWTDLQIKTDEIHYA